MTAPAPDGPALYSAPGPGPAAARPSAPAPYSGANPYPGAAPHPGAAPYPGTDRDPAPGRTSRFRRRREPREGGEAGEAGTSGASGETREAGTRGTPGVPAESRTPHESRTSRGARRTSGSQEATGARPERRRRIVPFGLRTRLILAFLLVAAVSAGTTATLTYREARNSVVSAAQDTAVASFRDEVEQMGSTSLPVLPDRLKEDLQRIARKGKPRPWYVYAEYGTLRISSGTNPESSVITPELRRATNSRGRLHGSFERVVKDGVPYLTIGMPVVFRAGGAGVLPTGLALYAVMPMTEEQTQTEALVSAARAGAMPGLVIALLPALLAASSVLRPVRGLRRAARNMGSGKLDTRIPVRGRDELADLARTFNESAGELERSVTELRRAEERARRFASDVSHELRTPLAGMLAVTEVLDEDAERLPPDTARAVRLISAETGKLAVLIEDLMEISRFDARAAELHTDEIDVAETIRRTLQNRHWTGGHPEQVRTDLPDGIRARLDPRRFDIVVANLVGNALRHGAAPVTLRLRRATAADGTPLVVTEVTDSGPGIRPDVLPHIFDRFYKADAARTRSVGSGLGLAITLENVRLHGGTIRAANRQDVPHVPHDPYGFPEPYAAGSTGAVFTVEIPLDAETPPDPMEDLA